MPTLNQIMVAQAGQPKGWPVSDCAGFPPLLGLPPDVWKLLMVALTINQRPCHVQIQICSYLPHRPQKPHSSFFHNSR
ncbi:TPA: ash family protein [Citrobacter freundii]|nr:ash family protein [Citrobacter freundii]